MMTDLKIIEQNMR